MGTLLYNVNEDNTTSPVSYYPSAVETGILYTDNIAELINAKEPLITPDTARAVINHLAEVCAQQLHSGNWVLLEDFIQIYTELDVNFGTEYEGDIQRDDLISLGDAQNQLEIDTEAIITYELNRYTFPKAPFVKSTLETKHNLIDHVSDGWGAYVYGYDFGVSLDDPETGVWLMSPAGNNYQQINNISFSDSTIIFVPDIRGELGPGGKNSVEHTLTVRGRYADDPIQIGNQFIVRAENPIEAGSIEMFLVGSQSGGICEFLSHEEGHSRDHVIIVSSLTNQIVHSMDGASGPPVDLIDDGDYRVLDAEGKAINLLIQDVAQLLANADSYGGQIIEVLTFESITFISFETTYGPGQPFSPSITKTGGLVSWYFGNGDSISDNNNPSYTGYVDSSLKVVTLYNIDDFSLITEIDISSLEIEGCIIDLDFFTGLSVFLSQDNNIDSYCGGILNATNLTLFRVDQNKIPTEHINSIVDDLWDTRIQLGANLCFVQLEGVDNGQPGRDAYYKIEGKGEYLSDGLNDNGLTVTYNTPIFPLLSSTPQADYVFQSEFMYYEFEFSVSTVSFSVKVTGLTGDCDLYAAWGRLPSDTDYDYYSAESNLSNEQIIVQTPSASPLFITVLGFDPGESAYTIEASSYAQTLSDGEAITDFVEGGLIKFYKINVPSGLTNLTVDVYDMDNDADLYMKYSEFPTTDIYDYISASPGTTPEQVVINSPVQGELFVGVKGFGGDTNYKILLTEV